MVRFLFITMIALINRFKTWINNPFIKSYTNSIHLHEFPATATQKIFYRIFFTEFPCFSDKYAIL